MTTQEKIEDALRWARTLGNPLIKLEDALRILNHMKKTLILWKPNFSVFLHPNAVLDVYNQHNQEIPDWYFEKYHDFFEN